jgi:hypothetical protein
MARGLTRTHVHPQQLPSVFPKLRVILSPKLSFSQSKFSALLVLHCISILVFSLPFLSCSKAWFHHFSPRIFTVTFLFAPHRPTAWAVFVLLTKGVVSIEGSFQENREEALVFLSRSQMHYLLFQACGTHK